MAHVRVVPIIKLFTMPMCSGCEQIKRRLNTWRIPYKEQNLLHLQNIFPSSVWSAPVLAIEEKLYEYHEMNTRDKLWKLVGEYQDMSPKKENTAETKLKITKKTKRAITKVRTGQINVDAVNVARVNVTVLRAVNGIDITDIINTWTMGERAAALIMWRIAQHQRADELLMLADMVEAKAKSYDPYKKSSEWIGNEDSWSD